MLVRNNFSNDSRVMNEASALSQNDYVVTVLALHTKNMPHYETIDNINVIRVNKGLDRTVFKRKLLRLSQINNRFHEKSMIKLSRSSLNKFSIFPVTLAMVATRKALKLNRKLINVLIKVIIKLQSPIIKRITMTFNNQATTWRLLNESRNIKADFYYCHDLNTMFSGYIASWLLRKPLIYDSHELYVEKSSKNYTNKQKIKDSMFEKFVINRATKVITVNPYIASELRDRYNARVDEIILNCPKRQVENKNPAYHQIDDYVKDGHKLVIYVGALTFGRGIEQLIYSVPFIRDDIKVAFLGGAKDSYLEEIKNVISNLKISNRVIIFPPVEQEQVVSVSSKAHVGVAPIQAVSLNNIYSSPNKIFQYIMAGLPIIASDVPFYRDIIVSNKIGKVFRSDSVIELANSINEMLANDSKLEMIKRNVISLKSVYNWEEESKKLVKLLNEV